MSVPGTSLEVVKIGHELLSSNIALRIRFGQAESREREEKAVHEAAYEKLSRVNSDACNVVELRNRQAASDVYMHK